MGGEPEKAKNEETATETESTSDDDAYTWVDLLELSYKELRTLCKENELETNPKDYEKDEVDDFRKEVAKEIDVKIPEEEEKEKGEEKDDKYTWEDLKEMDFDELEDLCDEEDLKTDPDDYDDEESKLRKAIGKELGIAPDKPGKK